MVFSSLTFIIFFLPITVLLYYVLPKKCRNYVLLINSLVFYWWGGPEYLKLMLRVIALNYTGGLSIDKSEGKFRKAVLVFFVMRNISVLGYFKYFNFLMGNINKIATAAGLRELDFKSVVLPVGISFYIFQSMSYIVDVYRKEVPVQKSIFLLALYISFFPQLIAGPIVQYGYIESEIKNRQISLSDFNYGVKRFCYGLGKKVIIANELGWFTDKIFAENISNVSTSLAWFAVIAYFFQIYYDFSGYSDMAIGLGRMFGFHFPENFNYPYLSKSITEFWRRWHISLSSWFREYIYIPLGGNRKGQKRTYLNLFIVFFVTGVWHGASWQFFVWGIYYAVLIIAERAFLRNKLEKHPAIGHIYTLFCVLIGWVIFRGNGLSGAFIWLKKMFIFTNASGCTPFTRYFDTRAGVILLLAVLFCGPLQKIRKVKEIITDEQVSLKETIFITAVFLTSLFLLVGNTYNPFIYFQF